jgi:hypothetical protein
MSELGIDVSDRVPRQLTRELAQQADVVVTMGCGDERPYIPGKRYIDWDLQDPKGRPSMSPRHPRAHRPTRTRARRRTRPSPTRHRSGLTHPEPSRRADLVASASRAGAVRAGDDLGWMMCCALLLSMVAVAQRASVRPG